MNIHEYQAKQLLAKYGVAVPRGGVAYTRPEAEAVAKDLGGPVWVVKSQIHAGGRGAGRFSDDPDGKGGVRVVSSLDDVKDNVGQMLGHVLVTKQTGEAGKEVKKLPMSLGEALDRLAEDEVIKSAMPGDMYKIYHWYKNDEWEKFMHTTTEWDLETYLDCLP